MPEQNMAELAPTIISLSHWSGCKVDLFQRLQATDRCMEGLYDITRHIRDFSEAYPDIGKPLCCVV